MRGPWRCGSRAATQLAAAPSSAKRAQMLDKMETQYVEEELARPEERAELDEAWALLRERVESCHRQDVAARAACEEAMRFAKETHDSVKPNFFASA